MFFIVRCFHLYSSLVQMHAGAYFYMVSAIGLAILAAMVFAFRVALNFALFCGLAQRVELVFSFTCCGGSGGRRILHVQP